SYAFSRTAVNPPQPLRSGRPLHGLETVPPVRHVGHWIGETFAFTPAPANEMPLPVDGSVNDLYSVPTPVCGLMVTTSPEPSWVKPNTWPSANAVPNSLEKPVGPIRWITPPVPGSIFTSTLFAWVPMLAGSLRSYAVPYMV